MFGGEFSAGISEKLSAAFVGMFGRKFGLTAGMFVRLLIAEQPGETNATHMALTISRRA